VNGFGSVPAVGSTMTRESTGSFDVFVPPMVTVAGVPGLAIAPSGSIDLVVSESSTSGTSGTMSSLADAGSALSESTVAVLVIGTPSWLYGMSSETVPVMRICDCCPLFTLSAV
jgi:hypothetical protein